MAALGSTLMWTAFTGSGQRLEQSLPVTVGDRDRPLQGQSEQGQYLQEQLGMTIDDCPAQLSRQHN